MNTNKDVLTTRLRRIQVAPGVEADGANIRSLLRAADRSYRRDEIVRL